MARTKIVATLGPATETEEMIKTLADAGVDVFRLNMSHGEPEWHKGMVEKVRAVTADRPDGPAAILGDLSGPKVRVGRIRGGEVMLEKGQTLTLVPQDAGGEAAGDGKVQYVNYPSLGKGLQPGMQVLLADGMLSLEVVKAAPGEAVCAVVKGGLLKEHKGVNFPGMPLDLPPLTAKDEADIKRLVEWRVDYVAMSFVREAGDVKLLKERMREAGAAIPVISKIERPEAIQNLRHIVRASDAVMLARGDLGVEMPLEKVPPLQKLVIKVCNEEFRPVITATQMLESMIANPRPTRAEASDVAGAVFDGTDALMLSEETAAGGYPEAAVTAMEMIAAEAERHLNYSEYAKQRAEGGVEALAVSACRLAWDLKAKAIISFTRSGSTALLISKYRPSAPVIAVTPYERTLRRMKLYFGVIQVKVDLREHTEEMIKAVEEACLSRGLAANGDLVILTLGIPPARGETNLLKVHRVGETFGAGA